jgi:predicted glutamine amidotransferase
VDLPAVKKVINELDDEVIFYLGHTQAPTSSSRKYSKETAHPFNTQHYTIAHNGVLSNFKELKEMVFKPEFEKEIQNYKFTFIYKVNNTSSKKNLVKLATLYFGNPDYKFKIKDENKLKFNTKDELPQDLEVIIPNY